MDADELRAWLEDHHRVAATACWEADDPDGFAALRTPDVVQVSFRPLSDGYAEGRYATDELWTVRPFFPFISGEPLEVRAPDRCLLGMVLSDGDGNEIHSCTVIRFLGGRMHRELIYDADDLDAAKAALDDIDAICADAKRRYAIDG